MTKLAVSWVVTTMLLAAGCATAGRDAVPGSVHADLKRAMMPLESYVGKHEGR